MNPCSWGKKCPFSCVFPSESALLPGKCIKIFFWNSLLMFRTLSWTHAIFIHGFTFYFHTPDPDISECFQCFVSYIIFQRNRPPGNSATKPARASPGKLATTLKTMTSRLHASSMRKNASTTATTGPPANHVT